MVKVVIAFVRHGETTANRDDILQGTCDYPLTEKGLREGRLVGRCVRNIAWDRIFTSNLPRAINTCNIMMETRNSLGCGNLVEAILPLDLIREISFGVREELPRSVSVSEARAIFAEKQGIDEKDVIDLAETADQVRDRQLLFLRKLKEEFSNDGETAGTKKVLCVSHGGFIRRFLANFCSHNIAKVRNCSISLCTVTWDEGGDFSCRVEEESQVDYADHVQVLEEDETECDILAPFASLQ